MNAYFFGESKSPLFGIMHPPRRSNGRAVLICPPIGHEHIRSHRSIKRLASELARAGFHVLRFDYRGIGDSSLCPADIQSVDIWLEDIALAAQELMDETAIHQIDAIGLRAGALLLSQAASKISGLQNMIHWEPVLSGADYVNQLRQMHATMIDLWMHPINTVNDSENEELVGTVYSKSLIRGLTELSLDQNETRSHLFAGELDRGTAFTKTDDPSDWDDLRNIELAWLSAGGVAEIVKQLLSNSRTISPTPIVAPTFELPTSNETRMS